MFRKSIFIKRPILTISPKRNLQKHPIKPEDAKDIPVFDYGVSSKTYKRVFVWGNIQTGALGIPYFKRSESPQSKIQLERPKRLSFAEKNHIHTAACGFGFTAYAVKNDESHVKLYGTGLNTDSQIGYHAIRANNPLQIIYYPQPISLPFKNPEKTKIRKLAAGRAHLVVLTDEGIFLLGNNSYGQCGRKIVEDENYFHSNYVNHIPSLDDKKIIDVQCGQDHTFALTEDGSLYSCGWGADGQTGLGFYKNCSEFTKVKGDIEKEKIVKVASRSDFSLAINDKGDVFGWGNAEYGQIYTSDNSQQVCNPTFMKTLQSLGKIHDVGAGGSFCVVVNEKGQVFVWGYGILGVGPNVQQSNKPLLIPETLFNKNDFQPNSVVKQISCGLSNVMAVNNLGDIFAWGRNTRGCLGLGNDKDQYFPLKVSLGGKAEQVFCGLDHAVAICSPFI